ncbi:protein of unknown function [Pseudomonas sp. JV551A1]|jgi:hypothetical protein|uniref:Uncharacterized protein n=1 Tax=Pseudomonas inefficax TaxID=2078786 RepID=A0AAQ1PB51_9PSED|nr:protein of unknown function [Pseudomonas sp. JV551A1]SPO62026.1 protein of unknown function [Pseudomonas inefficax]
MLMTLFLKMKVFTDKAIEGWLFLRWYDDIEMIARMYRADYSNSSLSVVRGIKWNFKVTLVTLSMMEI